MVSTAEPTTTEQATVEVVPEPTNGPSTPTAASDAPVPPPADAGLSARFGPPLGQTPLPVRRWSGHAGRRSRRRREQIPADAVARVEASPAADASVPFAELIRAMKETEHKLSDADSES